MTAHFTSQRKHWIARSTVAAGAVVSIAATSAGAQASAPGTEATHSLRETFERTIIALADLFNRPLHPVVSGVGPGGGIGAGLGYDAPGRVPWDASARAVYSVNRYWVAEGTLGFKHRRGEIEAFGRARDLRTLDYFGPGPTSNLADRASYSYKDPAIGAHGGVKVTPWLVLSGRAEQMWPRATSGHRAPSIEEVFPLSATPGLFARPRFGRYQGSVEVRIPAAVGDHFYQGTRASTTYAIYDDQTLEQFNFNRLDVEAQQIFAGVGAWHRLTLSGWVSTSTADRGQDVPFYLQHTLGGKSAIRSVNEHRFGSDGTDATLRGFRSLRFRDRHLLLMQAEYRLPIWGPVEGTFFADAGKVASVRSDLDLTNLNRDFGFSLSAMQSWSTIARVDAAFGSGEGARIHLSLGGLTP